MTRPSRIRLSALPRAVKAPAVVAGDTAELLRRSGPLRFGQGLIATILALSLGFLCLLGVIAFHFPQYLTTPELRHQYSVDVLRQALFVALLVAGGLSLANLVIGNRRNLNVLAFAFVVVAVALGGSRVPVGNFPDKTPYMRRMRDGNCETFRSAFRWGRVKVACPKHVARSGATLTPALSRQRERGLRAKCTTPLRAADSVLRPCRGSPASADCRVRSD